MAASSPEDLARMRRFETFMENYQDMVFTHAARLLGDDALAEDMAQEAFVRAYDHFDELENSPSRGGWLKTVTTNLCLNHLSRYRARWKFFSEMERTDDAGETIGAPEPAVAAVGSARMETTERHAALEEALRRLPAAWRVPLVMYHFEEISYDEIAQRLGVTLAKVKTDILRGREKLRTFYRSDE